LSLIGVDIGPAIFESRPMMTSSLPALFARALESASKAFNLPAIDDEAQVITPKIDHVPETHFLMPELYTNVSE
jgi:hypothetical protein